MTTMAERIQLSILREIQTLMDRAALAERLPDVPEPFQVESYDLTPARAWQPVAAVSVWVYQDDETPWIERVHALGATLRAFRSHNVKREIRENGRVVYAADGMLTNGDACQLTVNVATGGINPNCQIETETYEETVMRTRVKVTCD